MKPKPRKRPAKPRTFWLTRNANVGKESWYKAFLCRPSRSESFNAVEQRWDDYTESFCPRVFHAMTDIRLKPGAGPIRVQLVEVKRGK